MKGGNCDGLWWVWWAPLYASTRATTSQQRVYRSMSTWDGLLGEGRAQDTAFAAILMPLTFSIANGIAIGFITYSVVKVASGRVAEASPAVFLVAALGVLHYVFG